jgi:hypothetical protein
MNLINLFLIYTISFCVGIFVITYFLEIPHILTNNKYIVNQYYIENFSKNIPLDFLFVGIYLYISFYIIRFLKLKSFLHKLLIVLITTSVLTFLFCFYFRYRKLNLNNFFSKWFHTVGYISIIYDVILLGYIYSIYNSMEKLIHNN